MPNNKKTTKWQFKHLNENSTERRSKNIIMMNTKKSYDAFDMRNA